MKILPVQRTYVDYRQKHRPINSFNSPQPSKMQPCTDHIRADFMPSFTSVSITDKNGVHLNSGFYRDYDTLFATKKYIEKNIPQGCEIVVGASSTGEDLVSLYSILDKKDEYHFTGVDLSSQAIEMALNNTYGISTWCGDAFLITLEDSSDNRLKYLKKCFANIMDSGTKPDYDLNKHDIFEIETTNEYFAVKPEHFKKFNFVNADMAKLNMERPAGVIFFRQGIYQVTNNQLMNMIFEREFKPGNVDKKELLRPLINSVYKNLQPGGIFVIGNMPSEHIFLADKHLDSDKRIKIDDVPVFDNAIDYHMANPVVEIYKASPLYELLTEDNRFKPIFHSQVDLMGSVFSVPTIWAKVK